LGIWYNGYSSDNNYILLIDASGSMLADDYDPNRLEVAKKTASDFIDSLNPNVEVGAISFAGTSFLVQSLTNDKANVKDSIKGIDAINIGGTATGDATILAINTFKISDSGTRGRSIILLTDGQSNVGIDLEDAIDYAVTNGVIIHTLGIGTEEGGEFNEDGITSQLNPQNLEKLAKETGGNFYLVENEEEMDQAYSAILSESKSQVFLDARNYLLLIVFILLLIEWILNNTKYKTII
jgi:Ca-activated chloride channel homolog